MRSFLRDLLEKQVRAFRPKPHKFCLGAHVRHVLDSSGQLVAIAASNAGRANRILLSAENQGLQTLNHVIDSLYYGIDREDLHGADEEVIVLRVSFCMSDKDECDHLFDVLKEPLKAWPKTARLIDKDELRSKLASLCCPRPCCPHLVQAGVNWGETKVSDPRAAFELNVLDRLFGRDVISSPLWNGYVCGVQKVCNQLRIEPSILTFQSVMAAIYQLGLYAEAFGRETVSVIMRPKDHFGFVVGVTLISDIHLTVEMLEALCATIYAASHALRTGKPGATWRPKLSAIERFRKFSGFECFRASGIGQEVKDHSKAVACSVFGGRNRDDKCLPDLFTGDDFETNPLWRTVGSFLDWIRNFCEERFEGRGLRFGVVLGNPRLLKYWPGPAPVPLGRRDEQDVVYFNADEIAHMFHMTEDPQHRAIVVPYLDGTFSPVGAVPAYIVDLEDFEESLTTWSRTALWPPELRPYAYLTERYPWAVAAVVGPGSEIRLFAGGKMVLYRDGKGWREHFDIEREILRKCPVWSSSEGSDVVLRALLELAIQISPITRPASHGGLILYAGADDRFWKIMNRKLKNLRVLDEPPRPGAATGSKSVGWLNGLELLRPREVGGGLGLDVHVARLGIRASSVDGALVLSGPTMSIRGYGKQVLFGPRESRQSGGTKTTTAKTFAKFVGRHGVLGLGISVSADGPVRVFYADTAGGEPSEETLYDRRA
jgi:hypothetical protein